MTDVTSSTHERRLGARDLLQHRHALSGVWRNQFGSELVLHADGFGALTGSFRAATLPADESGHGVSGSYDADTSRPDCVLAFTVRWPETHALTAWAGRYRAADDTVQASWLMVTEADPEEEWRATVIGNDVFHRVASI